MLQLYTACLPQSHKSGGNLPPRGSREGPSWHPTRLFLAGSAKTHKKRAIFNIVVSSVDMNWQEFHLGIYMQTRSGKGKARFAPESAQEEKEDAPETSLPLEPGDLCTLIDQEVSARIGLHLEPDGLKRLDDVEPLERLPHPGEGISLSHVVHNYKLTVKDKVVLAHAIARACWQFYASDLMRQRWTSSSIWFMPEDDDGRPADQLPLKAYVSLDFSGLGHDVPEFLDKPLLAHRLPRVLALAIMLLEVGLGRPFRPKDCTNLVAQINTNHGMAKRLLRDLEAAKWDDFKHKDVFVKAAESCLDYKNFLEPQELKSKPQVTKASTAPAQVQPEWAQILEERRQKLYGKVVRPLAWLVEKGFRGDAGHVSYITRRESDGENEREEQQPQMAMFHAGKAIIPSQWLDNLKHIGAHIMSLQLRQRNASIPPVRVAVLDTGYDPGMTFFQDPRRADHIKGWRDFVTGSEMSDKRVDVFGHGSFMTRLLMESSPLADIYVARVAENTAQLPSNIENVAKAILWAGFDEKVDIIAMSFGFSQDDRPISDAISRVRLERRAVIFLASAGNSSAYQAETFPARHPEVISIHATDCRGVFLSSNPPIDRDGPAVLGTFGDNVPAAILEEIRQHFTNSSVCQPGTSIATAIAAGIVATMLAYAAVLPPQLMVEEQLKVFQRLKTMQGMTRMLEMMAPASAANRQRFINPIWFWGDRSTDLARACALHDCMWKATMADV
ncbi:hypothetical protein RB595_003792 [Gaeumannomyces hyphopodioides]